jgi:hypothetical protein
MGEGRSGSTVLDIILSNLTGAVGVGELWTFLEDDEDRTSLCSCKREFRDCTFWNGVRERFLAEVGESDLTSANTVRRDHDRLKALFPRLLLRRRPPGFDAYVRYNTALYAAIEAESGASIIIDSTKHVGRALNLLRCPDLDVHLIHLVRDGRAIAWSKIRDLQRRQEPGFDRWRNRPGVSQKTPHETILTWLVKNALALRIGALSDGRYSLVRYEDLITRPRDVLHQIGREADLDMSPVIRLLDDSNGFAQSHQIGGNGRARLKIKRLRLSPDIEWQRRLPGKVRTFYWITASLLGRKLGYLR